MKALLLKLYNIVYIKRLTSCSTEGSVPPSLSRPQPVTVAFSPIRRSSEAGRQIGEICGANSNALSSCTRARSYSYVKKLYLGWTTFRATALSTNGSSSWTLEKSYSPTRILIWDVSKLKTKQKQIELIIWSEAKLSYLSEFELNNLAKLVTLHSTIC